METIYKPKPSFLKRYWGLIFVAIVGVSGFGNMVMQSRQQDQMSYNFVIDSVVETSTKSAVFYKKDSAFAFSNYAIPFRLVKVGDVIYKPKMSYFLFIKRKSPSGEFHFVDTIFPKFNFSGLKEPTNKYWGH